MVKNTHWISLLIIPCIHSSVDYFESGYISPSLSLHKQGWGGHFVSVSTVDCRFNEGKNTRKSAPSYFNFGNLFPGMTSIHAVGFISLALFPNDNVLAFVAQIQFKPWYRYYPFSKASSPNHPKVSKMYCVTYRGFERNALKNANMGPTISSLQGKETNM
jgi:hypothetical protein